MDCAFSSQNMKETIQLIKSLFNPLYSGALVHIVGVPNASPPTQEQSYMV